MISTTGRMPCIAAPMPGADDRHLGDRRVAHALGAELLEEALRDAHRAAHLGDVLAHEEDVLVGAHRLGERVANRFAVGDLGHSSGVDVLEGVFGLRVGAVLRELDRGLDDLVHLGLERLPLLGGDARAARAAA